MIFIYPTGERTYSLKIEGVETPDITPRIIANGFLQYLLTCYDGEKESPADIVSGFISGQNDRQEIVSGKALDKLFDLKLEVGLNAVDPKKIRERRLKTMVDSGVPVETIRSDMHAMDLTDMSDGFISDFCSDRIITLNHEGYESTLYDPIARSFNPIAYPAFDTELYSELVDPLSEEDLEKFSLTPTHEQLQMFGRSPTVTSRQAGVLVKEYRDMDSTPIVTTYGPEYLEAVRASRR